MLHRSLSTLEPLSRSLDRGFEAAEWPVLEILFHADLGRVGARTDLEAMPIGQPLIVGRSEPLFARPGGGSAEPLADPCVSRQQFTVTALSSRRFQIDPIARARREVRLFALDGSPRSLDAPDSVGTLIAIGDRVLLRLASASEAGADEALGGLVGESDAMRLLRAQIGGAAASDSAVLLHGESGVGKELVAEAIHRCSGRGQLRQLAMNCAAIPENLIESELFGHVRGAFSGATADKEGFFRAAGQGTVFLDEVGELPLSMQGKLLRVLQERKIRRVGGIQEESVDARVIAATNRDLQCEVAEGRFREDLYFRLTPLTIEVPPLRERREDIMALFVLFLRQSLERYPELRRLFRPVSQNEPVVPMRFVEQLLQCDWPGNVRHLRNMVERIAVANLHEGPFCVPEEVARELSGETSSSYRRLSAETPPRRAEASRKDPPDQDALWALLEDHDFVQSRVARAAGVSHTTVNRWMRELGVRRARDLTREEIEATAEQAGRDLAAMARALKVSQRGLQLRMVALGIGS